MSSKYFLEIKNLRSTLKDLEEIQKIYDEDVFKGYVITGILNSVEGSSDAAVNLYSFITQNKSIKAIKEFKGDFKSVYKTFLTYKNNGDERQLLLNSINAVSKIEDFKDSEYFTNMLKSFKDDPTNQELIRDWLRHSADYLEFEEMKEGFGMAESIHQIINGVEEIGRYDDLNLQMAMKIAEEKAKINYRIKRLERKLESEGISPLGTSGTSTNQGITDRSSLILHLLSSIENNLNELRLNFS